MLSYIRDALLFVPAYVWVVIPIFTLGTILLFKDVIAGWLGHFVPLALKLAAILGAFYGLFLFWRLLGVQEGISPLYVLLLLAVLGVAVYGFWPREMTADTDVLSLVPRIAVFALTLFAVYALHASGFGAWLRNGINFLEERAAKVDFNAPTAPKAPASKPPVQIVQPKPKPVAAPISRRPASVDVPRCKRGKGWGVIELEPSWGQPYWRWTGICVQYRYGNHWYTYQPGSKVESATAYRFCVNNFFPAGEMELLWPVRR